jgi:hypothetical protein
MEYAKFYKLSLKNLYTNTYNEQNAIYAIGQVPCTLINP